MEQKKQTKFIMGKREIGKIILCLIIAIIMLASLKTIATTIIAGSANVIEDEKTIVRTAASVSRGASSSNKVELGTLTTELGRYASTTVTQISSEILQVKFNRTGNIYEINVNIGPTFDVTGTIPYLPAGYTPVENTDLETGFVIEDEDGNQFIWVEVPRTTTVYPTAGTGITAFTSTAYDKIEADLHTYTSTYRDGTTYTDTWSSEAATGLTENEYYIQKKKMLKSIYKNGGFYVGRYETGIDYSQTPRTASGTTTQTPVIKQNAYPYNFVTTAQSQVLAESFEKTGYETSLMFGVQWDLIMKDLETSGAATQEELTTESTWGNYSEITWNVTNTNAKYSSDAATWTNGAYGQKEAGTKILLTTGATNDFSKKNIYDLQGNVGEKTLENGQSTTSPNSARGGWWITDEGKNYASSRTRVAATHSNRSFGFRVCLYKDETDNTKTPTYIPRGYTHIDGDMESGYVIADSNGNEYVWVEVPRTATVYPTAGTSITSFTSTAYDKIEADLHTYTSTYRNGTTFTDTWSSEAATGMTETEYNTQKQKMLKSIYKNGGFYVGRYETGIADSQPDLIDTIVEARTAAGPTTQTPVIQANAYPYFYVTCSQAQELAESFETEGYETSLMFGVQWDLIMKFLVTSGAVTESELMVNSTNIGNYKDNLWSITNTSAKFARLARSYSWVDGTYSKTATDGEEVILSTGAHSDFFHMGISDIAGNVCEWTLEYSANSEQPSVLRDGYFGNTGAAYPSNQRWAGPLNFNNNDTGFRVALYRDETLTTEPTYIPSGYTHVAGDMDSGYVIADASGNEYVWVEVPRTGIVYPTAGTNIISFTEEAFDAIEADLHTYTSVYRNGTTYTDTWSSEAATGMTETEYNIQKKKMLKSIYKNGGFYVGRYEAGIDYSQNPRTASGNTTQTPVIKQNAYPYNHVTASQAQSLSEQFAQTGYISSLMFGVQWDLILKYFEINGTSQADLKTDSTSWGNYIGNAWEISNTSAKYTTDNTTWVNGNYAGKTEENWAMLTTGASDTFCKQNIYDFAGNVFEWTLEYTTSTSKPNASRGGSCYGMGYNAPASARWQLTDAIAYNGYTFRVCLYKDESLELNRIYNASNLDGNGTTGVATTTLKDLSGNYDATIYGSPTFGNGYISLNEGSATNPQYIDIGPIFDLETVTVNIRFSVSEIGTKRYLMGNWDTAGWGLEITADGKLTWVVYTENGTAYEYFYSNTILQTNTIYDVCAIYDGTMLYLYVNGVLDKTLTTTGGNIKNPGEIVNVFIGANPSSNATDSDRIDYVDKVAKIKLYEASISSQVQHPES